VEYQLEPNVINLFPEKHNHQKLLLFHNIAAPHTYRYISIDLRILILPGIVRYS
jgi:hypothetical protein